MRCIGDPFVDDEWCLVDDYEYRIYLDDRLDSYAVVDFEDYQWATKWRWHISYWNGKPYVRRSASQWKFGVRQTAISYYLHIEIIKRFDPFQPTVRHKLVDHRDGDSLNCRRSNLRWATHRMNVLNIRGSMPYDEHPA